MTNNKLKTSETHFMTFSVISFLMMVINHMYLTLGTFLITETLIGCTITTCLVYNMKYYKLNKSWSSMVILPFIWCGSAILVYMTFFIQYHNNYFVN